MQTGTVSVERLWSSLQDMLPKKCASMSGRWFNLLSQMFYFRYNYRHFHARCMPAWTEDDSLLAERLEEVFDSLFP